MNRSSEVYIQRESERQMFKAKNSKASTNKHCQFNSFRSTLSCSYRRLLKKSVKPVLVVGAFDWMTPPWSIESRPHKIDRAAGGLLVACVSLPSVKVFPSVAAHASLSTL